MPNTIDGQYILYVLLIFSFLSDIFHKNRIPRRRIGVFSPEHTAAPLFRRGKAAERRPPTESLAGRPPHEKFDIPAGVRYLWAIKTRQNMATVPAGRINKLFGTEGSVMLSLYDAFPEDFDPEQTPLLVTIDALEVPLWCERFERRGVTGAVASFADLDTDRRAEELLGLEFRIAEPEAGNDDEFYLEDLIGFAVEAEEAGTDMRVHGTLSDYYDSDVNPLFELEIDGRRVLVPAVEEFIAHIDFDNRTMHLILPEGLLGLE